MVNKRQLLVPALFLGVLVYLVKHYTGLNDVSMYQSIISSIFMYYNHANYGPCLLFTSYTSSKNTTKICISDPKMGILMSILRYHLPDQPPRPTIPSRPSMCLWRVNAGKWQQMVQKYYSYHIIILFAAYVTLHLGYPKITGGIIYRAAPCISMS